MSTKVFPKSSSFWQTILADLVMYFEKEISCKSVFFRIVFFMRALIDVDFRILFIWRIIMRLVKSNYNKIAIILYLRLKSRYGVDLSPWAVVEPGIRLMHSNGTVVGPLVSIGMGSKIFHQVTMGKSRPDKSDLRMPTVGRFCIIGAGAKILGPIEIGDFSLIGANAVITSNRVAKDATPFSFVDPSWGKRMETLLSRWA